MTIAPPIQTAPPQLLTYEQYLAEGEIKQRYEIIDGVRTFMPGPSIRHARISRKLLLLFAPYEETMQTGQSMAACDVVLRRDPLRVRQPDVLYISNERLALNDPDDPGKLEPAPELVIEIISPSERPGMIASKIADYQLVDVQEMWLARPVPQTVELLSLSPTSVQSIMTYRIGDIVQSVTFPGLSCAVADIFAEP